MRKESTDSQREVFSERVTFEAVVGEDAAQVGMVDEEDAKQVVDLAFVPAHQSSTRAIHLLVNDRAPVRCPIDLGRTRDGRDLVGVGLDLDPAGVADAEELVDDLEPLGAGGVVDPADGHHRLVLALRMVPQEREDRDDAGRCRVERQLVLVDLRRRSCCIRSCQAAVAGSRLTLNCWTNFGRQEVMYAP